MMRIYILTLFPEFFQSPLDVSILKRAQEKKLVKFDLVNIRDFSRDKHKKVDDYPYGGGCGMVMKPEPIFEAVEAVQKELTSNPRIILLTPQGRTFNHDFALELSQERELVFICGHYEGIDERVRSLVTDEVSIGDFVLTGGEIPALAIVDATVRLIPGVLGSSHSPLDESFCEGLLEYPQYTRPEVYRGMKVPDVLLSGNHQEIARFRRRQALIRTFEKRPDLLQEVELSDEERDFLRRLKNREI